MQKVTYLLGAGASAQYLPVVNKMAEKITEAGEKFQNTFGNQLPYITWEAEIKKNNLSKIRKDLEWLKKICETHYSVDTYAKKLYLKGNEEELFKLKNILSIFFTIRQKLTPPDKRYDNFWASILGEKDKLPQNMRIISWNYDTQLELSDTPSRFLTEKLTN